MAMTLAQAWKKGTTTPGGDPNVTLDSSVAVGDKIIAVVTYAGSATETVTSVTDTLGNSYTKRSERRNTSQDKAVSIWDTTNGSAGTPTLTADITNAPGAETISAGVYHGDAGTITVDQVNISAQGASGIPDYGSLTPGFADELIVAAACGITSAATADTGFTNRLEFTTAPGGFVVCDEVQSGGPTTRATFLTAPNLAGGWAACAASWREVAGGGSNWGPFLGQQQNRLVRDW